MSAIQASFPTRFRQRSGARPVSVLTQRYGFVRPETVVDLPVRQDRHRGSIHETTSLYDKTWIDPVCAIAGHFDIDYSGGLASCLGRFDVVQDYLGGTESWSGSHKVDFALGAAVCLWQTFEVIQSYFGGNEAWPASHDVYFALGRSVCLYQTYRIDQPYVGGVEEWPSFYETSFSSGGSNALYQTLDIVQPYTGGGEIWTVRLDIKTSCMYGQVFLVGTDTAVVVPGAAVACTYDTLKHQFSEVAARFDSVREPGVFSTIFHFDRRVYRDVLIPAVTTGIDIDGFSGQARSADIRSVFGVFETQTFDLSARYDVTETASIVLPYGYDADNGGRFLLRLQEEAYYEHAACLTNLHTGLVTIVTATDLAGAVESLEDRCVGDARWELECWTTVRFYSPDRPDQVREPVRWRFMTRDGEHFKQGPVVSGLRAVTLPSFLELHFTADWPYRAFESRIDNYQFRPTREGDWFDLGIWTSESILIDTEAPPILIVPYSRDIRNYAVHVPRGETTKFIAVAPIRRFPYEEVGMLAEIDIP